MVRVFRQFIPIPFLLLGVFEYAISIISVYLGLGIWGFFEWGGNIPEQYTLVWPKALVFASVLFLALVSFGLYQRRFRFALEGMLLRLGMAYASAAITLTLFYYVVPDVFLDRGVFAWSFISAIIILTSFTRWSISITILSSYYDLVLVHRATYPIVPV